MRGENQSKRIFGDNPITRLRPAERDFVGQARMNTFERLTSLRQPGRRPETSKILTTPESIVREHRAQDLRLESERPGRIMTNRPSRIPWYQRINWGFAIDAGCLGALVAVAIYFAIRMVIPFLRMLRWG